MKSNTLALWSLGISVAALLFSIAVLVIYCPTCDVKADYMGVIVGVLALLVTALVGAQVNQYVFVDRRVEEVAGKIARIISRKASEDTAKYVAKNTANMEVERAIESLSLVFQGKDLIREAEESRLLGQFDKSIDECIRSISFFSKVNIPSLKRSVVEDALNHLKHYFEYSLRDGKYLLLKGQKPFYEEVLRDVCSEYPSPCLEYLQKFHSQDETE